MLRFAPDGAARQRRGPLAYRTGLHHVVAEELELVPQAFLQFAHSQNLTAETAQAALTPRTKAIIVVHLAGWPADMEMLMAFARQYGLKVIEDSAEQIGQVYRTAAGEERMIGSFGDMRPFIHYPVVPVRATPSPKLLLLSLTESFSRGARACRTPRR